MNTKTKTSPKLAAAMEYARQKGQGEFDRLDIMLAYYDGATSNNSEALDKEITPVTAHYDENGNPDGVRIRACGLDFMIRLHDEFGGNEVEYSKAEQFNLPDEKMARVLGFYRKEVNAMLEQLGGDPLDGWYWTSTPAEEVFAATSVGNQLFFNGANGFLSDNNRIFSRQVRVALAL